MRLLLRSILVTFSSPGLKRLPLTFHQWDVTEIVIPKVKGTRILVSDKTSPVKNPHAGNLREFSENRVEFSHAPFDLTVFQQVTESLILLRGHQPPGLFLNHLWVQELL